MKHLHKLKDFIENDVGTWEEVKPEFLEYFKTLSKKEQLKILRDLEKSVENDKNLGEMGEI